MKLLPYTTLTLDTDLAPGDVIKLLRCNVASAWRLPWRQSEEPFRGKVRTSSFSIFRNINVRNSFLPFLRGKVAPRGSGSTLRISMTLHPFVVLLVCLISAYVASFYGIDDTLACRVVAVVGLGIITIFNVLGILIGFWPEVDKAKGILEGLLATEGPVANNSQSPAGARQVGLQSQR